MKIVFVASEANPYVKTGGLADVAAALPKALRRRGHDVALILPHYRMPGVTSRARRTDLSVEVEFDYRVQTSSVYFDHEAEFPTFFVDAPQYFARDSKSPYGDHDDP